MFRILRVSTSEREGLAVEIEVAADFEFVCELEYSEIGIEVYYEYAPTGRADLLGLTELSRALLDGAWELEATRISRSGSILPVSFVPWQNRDGEATVQVGGDHTRVVSSTYGNGNVLRVEASGTGRGAVVRLIFSGSRSVPLLVLLRALMLAGCSGPDQD